MPSRGWYVVAALIIIGAIAGAIWTAVSQFQGIAAGLVQVVVPGGADLELKAPGSYTIFHEATSAVDGRIYASSDISGLRVTVRSAATGKEIRVGQPTGTATYSFSGRVGNSVLAFDIDTPGTYRLDGSYEDGRLQPQTVIAVGTGFFSGLFTAIALPIGIGMTGFTAGALILIVVTLKRRRALRGVA
jgi:hypothetical protein